jgi:hypothetical protein
MGIRPTRHVSILGHPRTVAMSERQHNVLNAAEGLLATEAYGKRRKVQPYIPRRVRACDDVSEFTTRRTQKIVSRCRTRKGRSSEPMTWVQLLPPPPFTVVKSFTVNMLRMIRRAPTRRFHLGNQSFQRGLARLWQAARLDTACDLPDVSNPLLSIGKKMEYGAIMPEIVCTWLQLDFGDIGDKPMHLLRSRPQAALRVVDCALRDIEDSDVHVSAKKEIGNLRA